MEKQPTKDTIYLPIRAFGDFTISASIARQNSVEKVPVVLPEYLMQLFSVLECDNFFKIIDVLKIEKYHKLFQLRRIKNMHDLYNLFKDILTIRNHLDKRCNYLLDYKTRRTKMLGNNLFYPACDENIYTAKSKLFSDHFQLAGHLSHVPSEKLPIKTIVVFPGSRYAAKALNDDLVSTIDSELTRQGFDVSITYHESEKTLLKHVSFFNNFLELKKLIADADLVISADSLPIHIAYFLDKFHFVIYNIAENRKWATPFVSQQNSFAVYSGDNRGLVKKILLFIRNVNSGLRITKYAEQQDAAQ